MYYFRMKLKAEKRSSSVLHSSDRRIFRMSYPFESVGHHLYSVSMAHPHVISCPPLSKPLKDVSRIINHDLDLPILPFGGFDYLTPQEMGH